MGLRAEQSSPRSASLVPGTRDMEQRGSVGGGQLREGLKTTFRIRAGEALRKMFRLLQPCEWEDSAESEPQAETAAGGCGQRCPPPPGAQVHSQGRRGGALERRPLLP